jgi:hypothetical protein
MTPKLVLSLIEQLENGTVTLSPGPLEIRVDESDARAATILKQLAEEDLTVSEVLKTLQSAIWWVQFWAST